MLQCFLNGKIPLHGKHFTWRLHTDLDWLKVANPGCTRIVQKVQYKPLRERGGLGQ